jgi:hypothetical protein
MLGEAPRALVGGGGEWRGELGCGDAHGAAELGRWQHRACAREGTGRGFIGGMPGV